MALGDALTAAQARLRASQDAVRESAQQVEKERQEAASGSRIEGGEQG